MAEYFISDDARDDLKRIYLYGYETWGEAQAERYTREIYDRFSLIADFPGLGLPLHIPGQNLFKFAFVSHIIIYSPLDDGVNIIRIFDAATDYMRKL